MPELPADFDLKLMPDWLKEPPSKNPYADYEGHDDRPRSRDRGGDDWGGRGRRDDRSKGRPNQGRRPDRPGGAPPRRDGPGGQKPDGRRPDRPGGRPDDRRGKPDGRRDGPHGQQSSEHQGPPAQPANVAIEFFPDESCAVSIARQIKSTHRAYSLFDLARMFLARPERHRLKISSKSVAEPLYQVGHDGPVSTDKAAVERSAFPLLWRKIYIEIVEKRDPPKGNFTNVARCRGNGVLLGPTNYHGYQPALRKLYEERFSRRMSFSDFQREIEVVSDAALVEQWKQQAGSVTVYHLKPPEKPEPAQARLPKIAEPAPEAPLEIPTAEAAPAESAESPEVIPAAEAPAEIAAESPDETPAVESAPEPPAEPPYEGPVFNSLNEVENHFRENYLPGLIRLVTTCNLSGQASRSLQDRAIAASVRLAWEQERGFPGQMMHQLRQHFSRAGLHVFKHRKRMQFVSLIRPSPMESGSLSPSVAEIIQFVQTHPNRSRVSLATAILGADESAIDPTRKSTLATDLRWLIETGRVIEFSDGLLDLPFTPAPKPEAKAAPAVAKGQPAPPTPAEPSPAAPEAAPATSTEPEAAAIAPTLDPAPAEPALTEPVATAPVEPEPEPATPSPAPPVSES